MKFSEAIHNGLTEFRQQHQSRHRRQLAWKETVKSAYYQMAKNFGCSNTNFYRDVKPGNVLRELEKNHSPSE